MLFMNHFNLDFDESYLTTYEFCPVCKSEERKDITNSDDKEFGSSYLLAIAKYLQVKPIKLLRAMKTYECTHCSSIYCDPWFTPEISNELYSSIYGKHNFGWLAFDKWANDIENIDIIGKRDVIWQYLKKFLGVIDNYAELNCPFQGLYPMFVKEFYKQDKSFKNSRIKHMIEMRNIYKSYESFNGFPLPKKELENNSIYPKNNYLITKETSMFWGSNCSFDSVSCHNTSVSLFGLKKLPFNEIGDLYFDVFGSYSNIDHFPDPLSVIKRMLKHSKIVVLTLHNLDTKIHKQHLYKFGKSFPLFLKKQGINILEIPISETAFNPDAPENSQTILISETLNFNT